MPVRNPKTHEIILYHRRVFVSWSLLGPACSLAIVLGAAYRLFEDWKKHSRARLTVEVSVLLLGIAGLLFTTSTALQTNRKIGDLEDRVSGRQISDDEKTILSHDLSRLKGHVVAVSGDMDDRESIVYAEQIFNALREAGLNTSSGINRFVPSGEPPALRIQCFVGKPFNMLAPAVQDAFALRGAFVDAGLLPPQSKVVINFHQPLIKTDWVEVVVGSRIK